MAVSPLLCFMIFLFPFRLVFARNSTIHFPSDSSLFWTNYESSTLRTYRFPERVLARVILITEAAQAYGDTVSFALAFYCNQRGSSDNCVLAIIIVDTQDGAILTDRSLKVVWMANRNKAVEENATLHADPFRGLVLKQPDGKEVWATDITGKVVGGMALVSTGDLVLINNYNSKLWHSFHHPSDTLVINQKLSGRKRLISSRAGNNPKSGKFSLSIKRFSLSASIHGLKQVQYLDLVPQRKIAKNATIRYVQFTARSLTFVYRVKGKDIKYERGTGQTSDVSILKLDPDGGLRIYLWQPGIGWSGASMGSIMLSGIDLCQIPMACGKYGVCTRGGCSCPIATDGKDYFSLSYPNLPNYGCAYKNPSNVSINQYQLAEFGALSYFSYADPTAAVKGLADTVACKQACERNSSCMAAFFRFGSNKPEGLCYLHSEVLTIKGPIPGTPYISAAFIKVPPISLNTSSPPIAEEEPSVFSTSVKVSSIVVGVVLCAAILATIAWRMKDVECQGKDCFDKILGLPMRFSYKELSFATGRFSTILGRGGFGTVFKGELKDGTEIAVKRLHSVEQGMNEFLAEMKTTGSIHHVNLVKLIGFCADETNRLLVYEYMDNGSLDKWIFHKDPMQRLNWLTRKTILLEVAKGLSYLHEECSQRIAHLDVKPHNILLDENFNPKISDFGLSRFIDRNQSHVVTAMRGTFGYLAPEWQHSRITVKADIYSFGIVILEAVSGRMILDYSQDDSEVNLLGVLQKKASEDRMIDIVDKKMMDWECHEKDVIKMIRIGAWCLTEDQSKRPLMSTVVKVLEGTMEIECPVDFKFAHVLIHSCTTSPETSSKSSSNNSYSC